MLKQLTVGQFLQKAIDQDKPVEEWEDEIKTFEEDEQEGLFAVFMFEENVALDNERKERSRERKLSEKQKYKFNIGHLINGCLHRATAMLRDSGTNYSKQRLNTLLKLLNYSQPTGTSRNRVSAWLSCNKLFSFFEKYLIISLCLYNRLILFIYISFTFEA